MAILDVQAKILVSASYTAIRTLKVQGKRVLVYASTLDEPRFGAARQLRCHDVAIPLANSLLPWTIQKELLVPIPKAIITFESIQVDNAGLRCPAWTKACNVAWPLSYTRSSRLTRLHAGVLLFHTVRTGESFLQLEVEMFGYAFF